jgi:hypothetical protein
MPGNLFAESKEEVLRADQEYSLKTFAGEQFTGRAEFIRPLRGFCASVLELNEALLGLTIEGVPFGRSKCNRGFRAGLAAIRC